jgi:predicted nucleotide-binding protein
VFGLSQGTLESLIKTTRSADFAILLVTADDQPGERQTRVLRDNIIFEIGLFMGLSAENALSSFAARRL